MSVEVKVPSMGESILEVTLAGWLKRTGEVVDQDEAICEIESDKATVELVAEAPGVLTVLVDEGETVAVGAVIASIAPATADLVPPDLIPGRQQGAGEKQGQEVSPPSAGAGTQGEDPHYAEGHPSPAAKKMMAERGLDSATLRGGGKGGRITKSDVLGSAVESSPPALPVRPSGPVDSSDSSLAQSRRVADKGSSGGREVERKPMTPLRKTIARRLLEAKNSAAMLTTFNEVDMQRVMAMRKKYQEGFVRRHGIKLGFMSLFTKALVESIRHFPAVNAAIDGDDLLYYHYADVGIAVSTPRGLVVPVVRNAGSLSLAEIEMEIVRLATKAREGKLSVAEMSGGTITITNGGIFGSMLSTPLLNSGQSAILGMHNIVDRALVVAGEVVVRPVMYLAVSYDHRIIDGKESVGFLKSIKEYIEDPAKMLLDL